MPLVNSSDEKSICTEEEFWEVIDNDRDEGEEERTERFKQLHYPQEYLELRDEFGDTPLLRAAANGRAGIVAQLLKDGADRDAVDKDGCNSLLCAIEGGHLDVVKDLLGEDKEKIKTYLKVRNNDQESVVHLAAKLVDNTTILELLIRRGAELEVRNKDGMTPLLAVMATDRSSSSDEAVRYLLKRGANIRAKTTDDMTALDLAVKYGRNDLAKVLLNLEEDGSAADDDLVKKEDIAYLLGKSAKESPPLLIAIQSHNEEMEELLRKSLAAMAELQQTSSVAKEGMFANLKKTNLSVFVGEEGENIQRVRDLRWIYMV